MDSQLSNLTFSEFWTPISLSLEVSIVAWVVVLVAGILAGQGLARRSFRGKALVETALMLPLVLPPTVVGFLLIIIFGKHSFIGEVIQSLFGQSLIFTWWAAVIASAVVAFPLMYQSAKVGFASVEASIEEAARMDGASEWKVFLYITLPLAKNALISGGILSFCRALGEFGATLMFAGNIPGVTQTIPTAIYVALDSGNMTLAWWWVGTIIMISFMMLWIVQRKSH
ncbi:molybdate ABC transporter permease subunit [Priestia endophytica]|uniref:molybdate ABC transporter permease subunit n=1 Tax=Priestia endophytica TaxID=135735 RepID=UPI000DCA887F|nr:molybdate ABC transporter permease subunit [Priestia endophytica]RAS78865.1 molybdenum ABC transporter permease subunit [Priestia endophytica]